jgi:23S rRNA (adenine2503-C2)-methyltransferase
MIGQLFTCLSLHPEIKSTNRLNIHFARMGEPTFNNNVIDAAEIFVKNLPILGYKVHPVLSTMCPKDNLDLLDYLNQWMWIKNELANGEAGLQLSINSTSDTERNFMFSGNTLNLESISYICKQLSKPIGRKITLNFAIANYQIDGNKLAKLFNPKYFICKLTPMHKTLTAIANRIETYGDYTSYYPYQKYEEELKAAGFNVLVFLASKDEDESRITCGNAILAEKDLTN